MPPAPDPANEPGDPGKRPEPAPPGPPPPPREPGLDPEWAETRLGPPAPAETPDTPRGGQPSILEWFRERLGASPRTLPSAEGGPPPVPSGSGDRERYVESGVLGKGGMGVVLETFDRDLRRPVAMKVVLEARDRDRVERFIEEAQVTGQLEHPNIVPVHELGATRDGKAYFTMKRVRGESLQSVIERIAERDAEARTRYPLSRLLQVFLKVCDAVAFAHSRDIVHRDLKPENVMVGDFGEVLVMDWGLAKAIRQADSPDGASRHPDHPDRSEAGCAGTASDRSEPSDRTACPPGAAPPGTRAEPGTRPRTAASRTIEGQVLGTPSYMPPEQAAGRLGEIDERSDVWSLGAILYALLCHEAPHTGESLERVLARAVLGQVVPPRKRSPWLSIPRELEAVCMRAMEPDPAARYPSAEALAQDVQAFLDRRLVSCYRYGPLEKLTRWVQRHPAASMGAGVGGFLLAAGAALAGVLVQQARLADARASLADLRAREAREQTVEAQADAASARSLLEKGRRVSAVLQGAEIDLAPVFRTLEQSYYSARPLEEKRKAGDAAWPRVEAYGARVRDDPASRATWLALRGWLRHLAGYEEEAERMLAEAAEVDPDVAYGRLFQALLAAGRFLEASRMPSVVFVAGAYLVREGAEETETIRREREKFEALLGRVREAGVWGGASAKDFGLVLEGLEGIRGRDPAAAEEALTRTLAIPEMTWLRADLLIARAKVRHLKRDYKAVEEDLDRLLDRYPDHVQARYYRGLLRLEEGRAIMARRQDSLPKYGEALELFDRAAREDPSNLAAHANRAAVRLQFGLIHAHRAMPFHEDFQGAIEDFGHLIERSPDANAFNLRGFAHQEYGTNLFNRGEEGDPWFRKALEDFSAALERDPGSVAALANRAEVALHFGAAEADAGRSPLEWFARGHADCEAALSRVPTFFHAYDIRGRMILSEARWRSRRGEDPRDLFGQAFDLYSQALERTPASSELLIRRGFARRAEAEHLVRRGEDALPALEASVADLARAAEIDPRYSRAHDGVAVSCAMLAQELRRQGKDSEEVLRRALRHFDTASALSPGYTFLLLNRALCRLELARVVEGKGGDPRELLDGIVQDCDEVARKTPNLGRAYVLRATANRSRAELEAAAGRDASALYARADADCDEAARLGSADWKVWLCQGQCRMALKNYAGAVESLEKAAAAGGGGDAGLRELLGEARTLAKEERNRGEEGEK